MTILFPTMRRLLPIVVLIVLGGTARAAAAADPDDAIPRVRSTHPYIRAMISEAQVRSDTFRQLVTAIEATDGIVYVEEGDCGHSVRSCLPLSVAPAGGFRILRVLIDARLPDWEVMASIGHELQHALEILRDPSATSNEAIYFLFSSQHSPSGDAFETRDAMNKGTTVRKEVARFARKSSRPATKTK